MNAVSGSANACGASAAAPSCGRSRNVASGNRLVRPSSPPTSGAARTNSARTQAPTVATTNRNRSLTTTPRNPESAV